MIIKAFEEQAGRRADRAAIKTTELILTYGELNRRANRLARFIRQRSPGTGTGRDRQTVGLLFGHNERMITAILAVLKAGMCYVPLSPWYPHNRLAYMLAHSQSGLLLSEAGHLDKAEKLAADRGVPAVDTTAIIEEGQENLRREIYTDKNAYIMYTSGSTGRPKGVQQSHENVVYYIRNWTRLFSITAADHLTLFSSFCHDGSVQDMFGALHNGAVLYLVDMKDRQPGLEISEYLIKEDITIWHSVPSLYSFFVAGLNGTEKFPRLRFILLGGEPLREYDIKTFPGYFPSSRLANVYGQTESSVNSVWIIGPEQRWETVIVGEPLDRTQMFLVDEQGREVEPLETGDIIVACPHISPGYWNDEAATAACFRQAAEWGRLYRTGDLGRLLLDGSIEFLGRRDNQVKIRGFRLEPGEIENQLLRHEEIEEAVVKAFETADDHGGRETYLCAYVVGRGRPGGQGEDRASGLRDYLADHLPDYMIPTAFVQLERFPLTGSGKIDRKSLPAPQIGGQQRYATARTPVETKLVEIWSSVLSTAARPIGIDDNFFGLGGHSLKAVMLTSRIYKQLHVRIPLTEVFKSPTIRGQARYIQGHTGGADFFAPLLAVEAKAYYPLSPAQRRLYFLQLLEPRMIGYNLTSTAVLEGDVDIERLTAAFKKMIRRHQSLRTSFHLVAGIPGQRVHRQVDFHLEQGTHIPGFIRPFDLTRPPLMRVGLVKEDDNRYLLVLDVHHIVFDGMSASVFFRECIACYGGSELPPLKLDYKDYANWQAKRQATPAWRKQAEFWLDLFAADIPVLNLPLDFPRPQLQNFTGKRLNFRLPASELAGLKALAHEEGATLFMVLLTIFNLLLMKLGSQEDIVVGTPIAGRNHPDLEQMIGIFVNTLALRNYPKGEKRFREFLQEVKTRTVNAFDNQDYPFDILVDRVRVNRDTSRNPLFDVMFILQNIEQPAGGVPELTVGGLTMKGYPFDPGKAIFDLNFSAVEMDQSLLCVVEYCAALFRPQTIGRFVGYFKALITGVIKDPGTRLEEVDVMPAAERRQLLFDFNDTQMDYPHDRTIDRLFAEQVERMPHQAAAVGRGRGQGEEELLTLTYAELDRQSRRLAHCLQAEGAAADSLVALHMGRSLEMLVAILGILQAGAAYLPIDPAYPRERIDYMLTDSGAALVLTDHSRRRASPRSSPLKPVPSTSLAYVIYTSGSTGRPKGVAISHRNVLNFMWAMQAAIDFSPPRTILALTTISFDIFVLETLLPLVCRLKVVLATESEQQEPRLQAGLVARHCIDLLQLTPSRLHMLVGFDSELKSLSGVRDLLVGGEALPGPLYAKVREKFKGAMYNVYGPTETTVWSTIKPLPGGAAEGLTIGRPLANNRLYILDSRGQPVPLGVHGEIHLGGIQLARGYLNHPELTAQKFINLAAKTREDTRSSPHQPLTPKSQPLYRTGDLGRFLPSGEIEFLGRLDHQVKLRGFRIEPAEIERQLLRHQDVAEAVVLIREDSGEPSLTAYIVPPTNRTNKTSPAKLRQYLAETLPDYMIPTYIVPLERLPLTPNGKLDRRALPEPTVSLAASDRPEAPTDELENRLAKIWSEVLGLPEDSIPVHGNFFDLGGHSLKALRLTTAIQQVFAVEVSLATIFNAPSLRQLAAFIRDAIKQRYISIRPVESREYYPLSSMQKRLYVLQQLEGVGTGYHVPMIVAVQGQVERQRLSACVARLLRHHESLRTAFVTVEGEPVQQLEQDVGLAIEYYESEQTAKIIREFIRPFDLSRAPLLRVGLIKTGTQEGRYVLMMDMHHIISDAVSCQILLHGLLVLYGGQQLVPSAIQYKDFCQWQQRQLESGDVWRQQQYWLARFSGQVPVLDLPLDFNRPAVQSFAGRLERFELRRQETGRLKHYCRQEGVTLYMLLLSAFGVLFSRLTLQEDIVIGTPTAGRARRELESVVGMFANTLALRSYPKGDKPFRQFLSEVKAQTLAALANQEYQFEDLVETVGVERDPGRNPLFDVMFNFQNVEVAPGQPGMDSIEGCGLQVQPYEYDRETAKFDLNITGWESGEGLVFTVEYCTALFRRDTVERFVQYFRRIVAAIPGKGDTRLHEIELLSPAEAQQLLLEFNRTDAAYPGGTMIDWFARQAVQTPDRLALVESDRTSGARQLSYGALNDGSACLAHWLHRRGAATGSIVALMMPRSLEMVVGILGILQAGAAYLPIDMAYPRERKAFIIADSGTEIVLEDDFPQLTAVGSRPTPPPTLHPLPPLSLAYVIYTSGSTGRPKGVLIQHGAVMNVLWCLQREYPLVPGDVYLLKTPVVFDVSVTELFGWFLAGARLAVLAREGERDPQQIAAAIATCGVTHLNFVPSMFAAFLGAVDREQWARLSRLKYIFLAGEALPPPLVRQFRELDTRGKIRLENIYGPTEGTIYASRYPLSEWQGGDRLPIGRPLANVRLYTADQYGRPRPPGLWGELLIGGTGVARGYLNRPELTAQKFMNLNLAASASPSYQILTPKSQPLYRTGDLARWTADGSVDFRGRLDHQIKIRGLRVELGEIEYQLASHEKVKAAVVLDKVGEGGDHYLCACIVPRTTVEADNGDYPGAELREFLSKRLPQYMIPSHFVWLEQIPLTASGKVDRPLLATYRESRLKVSSAYMKPETELERLLAAVWQESLALTEVGVMDNFFDMGGNSFDMIKMNRRLVEVLGREFPLVKMFKYPTIRSLAAYLAHGDGGEADFQEQAAARRKMAGGKVRLARRGRPRQ
jgi:amino acid adenylation domain-containing protein